MNDDIHRPSAYGALLLAGLLSTTGFACSGTDTSSDASGTNAALGNQCQGAFGCAGEEDGRRDAPDGGDDEDVDRGDDGETEAKLAEIDVSDVSGGVTTPSLIFVDTSGRLAVLGESGALERSDVDGEIRALGSSLHYDEDGVREVPLVVERESARNCNEEDANKGHGNDCDGYDEDNPGNSDGVGGKGKRKSSKKAESGIFLELVDLDDGETTTLDDDVMGYVEHGKLGIGDFDRDGAPDVFYPGDDKELMRVDRNESPTSIVQTGTEEGNDAKPWSIIGTIQTPDQKRLYWVDTGSNLKWTSPSSPHHVRQPNVNNIGTNDNTGVGLYRETVPTGETWMGRVTGGNDVELLGPWNDGDAQRRRIALAEDASAQKTPVGFGNLVGDERRELFFVDTDDALRYVKTDPSGAPYEEVGTVEADGEPIGIRATTGVVTGHANKITSCERYGDPCNVSGETGRCAIGQYVCVSRSESTCRQMYEPQPELCNGLDDDCDGRTDNIGSSWDKEEFENKTLPADRQGAACGGYNSCRCGGRAGDHAGREFSAYADEWDGACSCSGA